MQGQNLEQIWRKNGKKNGLKVRFNDWTHQIKYFTIAGESSDGKKIVGTLDNGEKISFSKTSYGWSTYYPDAENVAKAV